MGPIFSELSATSQILFCRALSSGNNEHEAIRQQSWFHCLKFVPETHIVVRLVHNYWEQKVPSFCCCELLCLHHSLTLKPSSV